MHLLFLFFFFLSELLFKAKSRCWTWNISTTRTDSVVSWLPGVVIIIRVTWACEAMAYGRFWVILFHDVNVQICCCYSDGGISARWGDSWNGVGMWRHVALQTLPLWPHAWQLYFASVFFPVRWGALVFLTYVLCPTFGPTEKWHSGALGLEVQRARVRGVGEPCRVLLFSPRSPLPSDSCWCSSIDVSSP